MYVGVYVFVYVVYVCCFACGPGWRRRRRISFSPILYNQGGKKKGGEREEEEDISPHIALVIFALLQGVFNFQGIKCGERQSVTIAVTVMLRVFVLVSKSQAHVQDHGHSRRCDIRDYNTVTQSRRRKRRFQKQIVLRWVRSCSKREKSSFS